MKQIVLAVLVFLVVLIVSVIVLFPYNRVVGRTLDQLIIKNRISLTYKTIDSGPFSTTLGGVVYNDIEVGDIKASYSVLSALTQSVKVSVESPYGSGVIKHSKSSDSIDSNINFTRLIKVLPPAKLAAFRMQAVEGEVHIVANYNNKNKSGAVNISGGAFSVTVLNNKFSGASLNCAGNIENSILKISSCATEGATKANVTGQISIDTASIVRSLLDLSVDFTLTEPIQMNGKVGIRGPLGNPQIGL